MNHILQKWNGRNKQVFGNFSNINKIFVFRCTVFMVLPHFFTTKGRQALLAYAFILALTGPAKNTLRNLGVMSESLACGQVNIINNIFQNLKTS